MLLGALVFPIDLVDINASVFHRWIFSENLSILFMMGVNRETWTLDNKNVTKVHESNIHPQNVHCLLFTHPARHGSCALMRLLTQWARCDHRLESHEHQCTRAASSWNTWDESRALSARHVSVTCASLLLRPLGHFTQTGEWWPTLPHSFKEYCSHSPFLQPEIQCCFRHWRRIDPIILLIFWWQSKCNFLVPRLEIWTQACQ